MAAAQAKLKEQDDPASSEDKGEKNKDESSAKKGCDDSSNLVLTAVDASESENGAKEEDAQAIPEDSWFYLDPAQTPQGPFTWEQMSAWYKAGYLQATLPVRSANRCAMLFRR